LNTTLGTEKHPGRVRTAGYGVGVRQYFDSASPSSSSHNSDIIDQISQLKEELTSQIGEKLTSQIEQKVRDKLKDELRHELIREFDEKCESMGISRQHTPLQEGVVLPTCGRASTKGSCAAEDEEKDTNTNTSYRYKLYVGDPPRLVAIGRVFTGSSMLYTVPLGDDFCQVVVKEVR